MRSSLAEPLKLSREQQDVLKSTMARMNSEAKALGAAIVDLERELDAAFAARTIDDPRLKEAVGADRRQAGSRQGDPFGCSSRDGSGAFE